MATDTRPEPPAELPRSGTGSVVGVDGSSGSLCALDWAVRHADRLGPVRPVMAWHYPWAVYTPTPFGGLAVPPVVDMQRATEESLAKVLAEHGTTGLFDSLVADGDAARVLMDAAESTGAGTIVVGTRGRGGFASLLLGSTSGHCAEHATVPVVIVPERPGSQPPASRPGESSRFAVGIDGSAAAERALRWTLDTARPGDSVTAVAAWELVVVTGYESYVLDTVDLSAARAEMLATTIARVRRPDDVPVTPEVRHGDPRAVLREMGAGADLLVVGARGTGTLAHLLVGSVAHSLVRHPECPVAVIPGTDRGDHSGADRKAGP